MSIQWSLVLFTVFAGSGAWLFIFVALDEFLKKTEKTVVPASVVSIILLAAGGIASITHLSHPTRMLGALSHPTSGIFMEALFIGLTGLAVLVYLVMIKREASVAARKVVAIVGIVLALALSFLVGDSYIMSSRPAWNTLALPIGYLGTASVCGAALYLLIVAACKEGEVAIKTASIFTVGTAALAAVTALAYGAISGGVSGDTAMLFWGCVIVCGAVVPALCAFFASRKAESALPLALVALCGGLVGSIAFRSIMWMIGAATANYFGVEI